ncbi:hypothetical protein MesoLj113a_08840 [Mesorhizobium sp. 113-1-2]|uniref:ParA family protein n=1 Tax=Mesorhizobium sp. 113-1-2 TaxID=2744515 RepID=UPI0019264482|nr:ParA family protein [Mesorhizobium sp. 113-1-2]BCG69726.1 hypothetical protein MesoLj113a_08840 [Mesorhizobium sp. 113-1-2]
MNAIVICMASAKGGSGKTTLTATFASFLAQIGKKVLVIDCDEATHGMTLLYLEQVNSGAGRNEDGRSAYLGLFDSSHYPPRSQDPLVELERALDADQKENPSKFAFIAIENGVQFIPATYYFDSKPQMEPNAFLGRLKWILGIVRGKFDYIFLDAQAGTDTVSKIAVRRDISDEVVIISEYDPLSAAGIERLKAVMGEDLNFTRTWILLNKMLPEFVKSFSEFLSIARYLPPIPWTADVVRAYARRRLALDFESGNQFTLGILQTLKALLPHADGLLLDKWAATKAAALRQPLDDQYKDAKNKLQYIYVGLENLDKRGRLTEFVSKAFPLSIAGIGALFAVLSSGWFSPEIYNVIVSKYYWLGLGIVAATAAVALPIFAEAFGANVRAKKKLERDTLLRQKRMVEEEMQKLDSLRTSELADIVNNSLSRSLT